MRLSICTKSMNLLLMSILLFSASNIAIAGSFKQDYDKAYKAFQASKSENDFKRVAGMFKTLAKRDDAGILKANTFYWQAECWYKIADYVQALQLFERVLVYPLSYKEEAARFKVATCYAKLNLKKQAKWEFSRFLRDYPNSNLAATARKTLDRLGGR